MIFFKRDYSFFKEKKMKRYIGLLFVFCLLHSSEAALTLQEIRTASNNVLVVVLKGNTINVTESDITVSSWKINGQPPLAVYRYAMPADKCDHHVYLQTAELVDSMDYALNTPYGDTTIKFSDHAIFCESIKTNQVAYSGLSRSNHANFAIWLGNGGGKKIQGALPTYEVFEQYTNKIVAADTLREIGDNTSSGGFVYRIDLSKVPEGGPYKIAVKGYGCSYPFGVGGTFSRRLAYTIFRGQYYQRCGCPIKAPYGLDIREKACHSTVYKTNAVYSEAKLIVGSEPSFTCYGGYHDAGDADRRVFHMSNPVINLMIYEAFPELFFDGQYNIPDKFDENFNIIGKGNGIPDIIDEARWGTLVWEYLQNDDGSIQFGTETSGYPEPFAAPLDQDEKKYGTVKIDDRAASIGAGLFMHLARVIRPYDSVYSNKLATRAEKSFSYISSKIAKPEKLYYYIQKYLFDGDQAAHEQVKTLKNAVDTYKDNLFVNCHGYSLNNENFDNPGYFLSYVVEKNRPTDPAVVDYFKAALKSAADVNCAELPKYAYPVGNNPTGSSWGHNTMQPYYACAPMLHWRFTHEQSYFDAACDMMNYPLGLNPLGLCFVTGLGMDRIHNPHDRESAYTTGKGWGPKPGITIFGPGVVSSIGGGNLTTFPAIGDLPVERKFGDDMSSISTAEFTIFETMTHYALYTVLSNGGTWNETDDPFAKQQVAVARPLSAKEMGGASLPAKMRLERGALKIEFASNPPQRLDGGLYLSNGKKVLGFAGMIERGNVFTVPIAVSSLRAAAGSVLICKIRMEGRRDFTGKIIFTR